MDIINHYDNGAKGLRIAATICVVVGWIALVGCIIVPLIETELAFIPVVLMGAGILAISYLLACSLRASATITEASQLYIDKNVEEINEDQ